MKRRSFLKLLGLVTTSSLTAGLREVQAGLFRSPVRTNRLRPPGAVTEDLFIGKCIRCVDVCPTGSLRPVTQRETRMGTAVINRFTCAAWAGVALCRTCYDVCPFKGQAIVLQALMPVVVRDVCTGCGLCTHACPVTAPDQLKAINIEPSTSRETS